MSLQEELVKRAKRVGKINLYADKYYQHRERIMQFMGTFIAYTDRAKATLIGHSICLPERQNGKLLVESSSPLTDPPDILRDVVYQPKEMARDNMPIFMQIQGSLAMFKVAEDLVYILNHVDAGVALRIQQMLLMDIQPPPTTSREPFPEGNRFKRRKWDLWHQKMNPKMDCDERKTAYQEYLVRAAEAYQTGIAILSRQLSRRLKEKLPSFEKEGLMMDQTAENVSDAQEQKALQEDFLRLFMDDMTDPMKREKGEELKQVLLRRRLRPIKAQVRDLIGWVESMEPDRQATEQDRQTTEQDRQTTEQDRQTTEQDRQTTEQGHYC
ncbi:hypothetical protein LTR96_000289 [Exophiala xenobiotica]|uniref:Uncharacterized protein n=1 Tax=Vermiconidia calcicola TaxID=1690605 RepID=A0AAV9Q6W9_9PEZI|nr:hypothetical protein LTR96_000289 [Exophiala xenobiotica]KAK5323191.1 hypothetical protein LTR93_005244 [Exophiala xenobiotica]KAK5338092.1 hypothetical protein LTR98_005941 [Exophiala xenobiotica]KAK5535289.1 hypothetical protein LTR25_006297 [Vermiconidia calcicola]KAK5546790.1 hypothetical protein LTR23_003161 [Chaetothyriales sp. CCFEE 6169]